MNLRGMHLGASLGVEPKVLHRLAGPLSCILKAPVGEDGWAVIGRRRFVPILWPPLSPGGLEGPVYKPTYICTLGLSMVALVANLQQMICTLHMVPVVVTSL
jgi:hypothetical protein